MAKLHELLAVEKDLIGKMNKIITEGKETFSKRTDHFSGFHKTLSVFNDEDKDLVGSATERKELVTTVPDKLSYVLSSVQDVVNVRFQKDYANSNAKADIVLDDGTTLAKGIPATTLLTLEDLLREVRIMCDMIPTLEPGIKWVDAPDAGKFVKTTEHPEKTLRTKKKTIYVSVAKATDKHPEQIREETVDFNIGEYTTHRFSGRISPAEKVVLLDKIEKLQSAVKKARARANETEVPSVSLDSLRNYLLS
jgi:hypothetical protein